jgi:hypothetical protein
MIVDDDTAATMLERLEVLLKFRTDQHKVPGCAHQDGRKPHNGRWRTRRRTNQKRGHEEDPSAGN